MNVRTLNDFKIALVFVALLMMAGCLDVSSDSDEVWIEPWNPYNYEADEIYYATHSTWTFLPYRRSEYFQTGDRYTRQAVAEEVWIEDTSIAEVRESTYDEERSDGGKKVYVRFKKKGKTTLHVKTEFGAASLEMRIRRPVEVRMDTKHSCLRVDRPHFVGQRVSWSWKYYDSSERSLYGSPIEPVVKMVPDDILDDEDIAQYAGEGRFESLIDDTEARFRVVEWEDIIDFDFRLQASHERYQNELDRTGTIPVMQSVLLFVTPLLAEGEACFVPPRFMKERGLTFTSETPEICRVTFYGGSASIRARTREGECIVRAEVPSVRGGEGWSKTLRFNIVEEEGESP